MEWFPCVEFAQMRKPAFRYIVQTKHSFANLLLVFANPYGSKEINNVVRFGHLNGGLRKALRNPQEHILY